MRLIAVEKDPWFHQPGAHQGGIDNISGETTSYALSSIEARGKLFIAPGTAVYPGMIIGEHSRDGDLEVNPVKAKQLTNIRAAGTHSSVTYL